MHDIKDAIVWIAGIGVPIMVVWQTRLGTMVRKVLYMLENPIAHGFGTEGMAQRHDDAIELAHRQLRATKELIHYTRYVAKNSNGGGEPPPYVGDPSEN
jgi:hypothetical protein